MGLVALLTEAMPGCHVGSAQTPDAALEYLSSNPDTRLITLDPTADADGLPALIAKLRRQFPLAMLVVVDHRFDRKTVFETLGAGAHGYIPKSMNGADMAMAIRSIVAGQIFVPPLSEAAAGIRPVDPTSPCPDRDYGSLTDRQREVLAHLATGMSNKEIARALRISESTVKVHVAATFRQLGVHNRVGAVAVLQGQGSSQSAAAAIVSNLGLGRRSSDRHGLTQVSG